MLCRPSTSGALRLTLRTSGLPFVLSVALSLAEGAKSKHEPVLSVAKGPGEGAHGQPEEIKRHDRHHTSNGGCLMTRLARLIVCLCVLTAGPASATVLESPPPGGFVSGLGFISGWVCYGRNITVRIDGGEPLAVAMHQERADTDLLCEGAINSGFIRQINWNHIGSGLHTIVAYEDGQPFAGHTFSVGSTGEEFVTGVQAECRVADFPQPGEHSRFVWIEATQHFELMEFGSRGDASDDDDSDDDPDAPVTHPLGQFNGDWTLTLQSTASGCGQADRVLAVHLAGGEGRAAFMQDGQQWEYVVVVASSGFLTGTTSTGGRLRVALTGQLQSGGGAGSWFAAAGCDGVWTARRESPE